MSIESKILKYINKSLNKNDDKYTGKLHRYINQRGGASYSEFVEQVILDQYNFNYLKPLIQEKLRELKCITVNPVTFASEAREFENHVIDGENLKLGCFSTSSGNNDDYLFKSGLKGKITDIFVGTIGKKLFAYLAHKIIREMSEMTETYVKAYNSNYANLKKKNPLLQNISNDDVIYLYKGGNIIRMYLSNLSKSLINSLTDDRTTIDKKFNTQNISDDKMEQILISAISSVLIDSKKTQYSTMKDNVKSEDIKIMNEITQVRPTQTLTQEQKILIILQLISDTLGKEKYGDYDMSFAINQELNSETYEKVKRDINALLIYKLQNLKRDVEEMITYIVDKKIMISAYSKDFVNDVSTNNMIQTYNADWKLVSLDIFNKSISPSGITDLNNNDALYKNSLVVVPRIGDPKSKNFIEVKKLLVNSNFTDIVNVSDLERNDIFLTQTDAHIIFVNNESEFTIARLKVNTICTIRDNNPVQTTHKDTKYSFPIELIDVAIPNSNDIQSYKIHDFLHKHHFDIKKEFVHNTKKISLPSIYYLYTDLIIILLQNVFVWEDKKYGKRLLRSILLALNASLEVEGKSHVVDYTKLKNHIDEILQFFGHQIGIGENQIFTKENYDRIKQKFDYSADTKYNRIRTKLVNTIDVSFFEYLMQIYIQCFILAIGIMKEEKIMGDEIDVTNDQEYYDNFMNKTKQPVESLGNLVMIKPYSYYAQHAKEYAHDINEYATNVVTYLGFVSEILSFLTTKPGGIKLLDTMDEF